MSITRRRGVSRRHPRIVFGAALAAGIFGVIAAWLPSASSGAAPANRSKASPRVIGVTVPTGVYLGVDPNFSASVGTTSQLATFEQQIGRRVAISSFYLAWTQTLPTDMAQIAVSGVLPFVSWHCDPAGDPAIVAGKEDAAIRAMAENLKAFARPVLLRWFWEMNLPSAHDSDHQACLGPGLTLATQQKDFVLAWQRIWTIFKEVGAANVSFVWCPSAAYGTPSAIAFYPGNAYVNWIGGDVYDRSTHPVFPDTFAPFYKTYAEPQYAKPMIIGETGAVGSADQVSWLSSIASDLPSMFPDVHALVYVDAVDLGDYRLLPGTAGLAAYVSIAREAYFSQYALAPEGYGFATSAGGVRVYDTPYYGDVNSKHLTAKIVGFAEDPRGSGYWLVGADGSIYPFGSADDFGSMRGIPLTKPIVGMAATADGQGYWFVASDGGIFAFGDARFRGSMGGRHLNKPIVGMASMPDGIGYWMVASDGGMFTFGDAKFRGSTGAMHLNKPIVGMSRTSDGLGYWLVAADGGIFTFGDAHFGGSLGATRIPTPVQSATFNPVTNYYLMLLQNGTVYDFPSGQVLSTATLSSPATEIATVG